MKVAFISHCGLDDNSGIHIRSLAAELIKRGHDCTVIVPGTESSPQGSALKVCSYEQTLSADTLKPDIIHAWTPREPVRKVASSLVAQSGAPLIVHMEDNEQEIAAAAAMLPSDILRLLPDWAIGLLLPKQLSHPRYSPSFLRQAQGYSCIIDTLLAFKPEGIPGQVFWPGYSKEFAHVAMPADRSKLGLLPDDIVIVYTGNVHRSVAKDVTEFYRAIALLRDRGYPVKLVKTGKDFLRIGSGVRTQDFTIDLGFVRRADLPSLLAIANLLVQPGAPSHFNDYRFPGKIPEYLVVGRPVILPNSNIGRSLVDGEHVLKLQYGTSAEIAEKITLLIQNRALAERLAANGRQFALDNLTWNRATDRVESLYRKVLAQY